MKSKEGKILKSVVNRPIPPKPVVSPTASGIINGAKSDLGTCNDNIAENKFCSSCGKSGTSSNTLKKCTACKCVYYCDIVCQKEHRKFHKEDCKLIKMVLQDQASGMCAKTEDRCSDVHDHSDPRLYEDPAKEVCDICMLVLPVEPALGAYMTCCGKKTCSGCLWELSSVSRKVCPFCRAEAPRTDEENLVRLIKRTEVNDPHAFASLGHKHLRGVDGVSVDETVGVDFYIKAASFGSIEAYCKLALMYYEGNCGLEMDKARAVRYWKLAAKGGDAESRHYLGVMEYNKNNIQAAIRHWRIASEAGFRLSIISLITEFSKGNICHLDIAETLQARDYAYNEAKSEQRDRYISYLRDSTGNRFICHSSYKL